MKRLNNTSRKSHLLTGVSVSLVCLRMKYFHACRHEDSHTELFQVNNQSQHFSEVLCKIYFGPKADLQKYNLCNHQRMRHHTESPVTTLPSLFLGKLFHVSVKANCTSYSNVVLLSIKFLHSTLVITKSQTSSQYTDSSC